MDDAYEEILQENFSVPILFKNITQSTNIDAKNFLRDGMSPPFIILAGAQLGAYGRAGNKWYGDVFGNLSLSYSLQITSRLSGNAVTLIQYVALRICQMLTNELRIKAMVKWPNDIFVAGKKVAGLMMEVVRGGCHMQSGILGVGMNILSAPEIHNSGYLGACLQDFSAHDLDFKRVMINTIQTIISSVDAFENIEIADICGMWNDFDCFYNSNVSIVAQNSRIKGVSRGIGKNGELLVIQSDGTVAKIQQGNAKIVLDSQV